MISEATQATAPQRKPNRVLRVLLFIILGALVLCLGTVAVLLAMSAGTPDASTEPGQLSAEQAALMGEALHLEAELGDALWPGFGQAQIPLLSFNEANAFLCAHPQPPAGWQALESAALNGEPCYVHAWSDGQNFAEEVGGRWAGSMITREWGLIELKTMLEGDLPTPLGRLVAVPMSREMLKPGRYLGGLVHESFHAYQATAAREWFDDAELAYPDGERYWQADPPAYGQWEAEIEALVQAVESETDAEGREHARRFLQLRQARRSQFSMPETLVRYEQRFEWLEGMAKYTELGILRAAAESTDFDSERAMSGVNGFSGYGFIEQFWAQELSQMQRQASQEGDVRFYYTGWAQGLLLDRFMPDWKEQVMHGAWLEDLLAEAVH